MVHSIGVVLATYNGEKFIAEQLESIIHQSLKPDVLVVVDDSSTDATARIIEKYRERHDFIRLYRNTTNIGYIKNFEKGISLCGTEYIALSDQDDIWYANKLERMYQELSSRPCAGLCYHNSALMNEGGQKIAPLLWELIDINHPLSREEGLSVLLNMSAPIAGSSILFHKCLKEHIIPFPGSKYCGHDWWICAIAFFLFDPVSIESPLSIYRLHKNQVSGAADLLLSSTPYAIKKRIFDINRIKKNVNREIYRFFNRKKIHRQRIEDTRQRLLEFDKAFRRLKIIVEESIGVVEESKKANIVQIVNGKIGVLNDEILKMADKLLKT